MGQVQKVTRAGSPGPLATGSTGNHALAGVAQLEHHPTDGKVSGLISRQGTYPGYRFDPPVRECVGGKWIDLSLSHWCSSLSLSLPPRLPSSLSLSQSNEKNVLG